MRGLGARINGGVHLERKDKGFGVWVGGGKNLSGDYFLRNGGRDMGVCAACNDVVPGQEVRGRVSVRIEVKVGCNVTHATHSLPFVSLLRMCC